MITHYDFGKFVIDGKTYESNIKLIDKKIKQCRHFDGHVIEISDFVDLVSFQPTHLVIGTGAYGVIKVSKEIIDSIESRGIKLIIEKTADACKKYNELLVQGKKVVALLHNTC
jgi:hypothetical protein